MKLKRAVIVHCWGGYPNYCWYPSVKKELEEKGFEVLIPEMPDTDMPKFEKWLPKLQEVASNPDEELYLVGHSLGCITILRYLEKLPEDVKIGGVVFVAGFTDDLSDIDSIEDEIKSFFEIPIRWDVIKTKAKKFVAMHSDNDPYVSLKYADIFKEKLDTRIIIKHKMGHFSGPVDDEKSCIFLPDVTQAILSMQ